MDNQVLMQISPQVGVDLSTDYVVSAVGRVRLSTASKQVSERNQSHAVG